MVAHEKRNPAQLFCAVPTQNDLALSSLLFSAHPTQKLGYPKDNLQKPWAFGGEWYARLDSNQRPLESESNALSI